MKNCCISAFKTPVKMYNRAYFNLYREKLSKKPKSDAYFQDIK